MTSEQRDYWEDRVPDFHDTKRLVALANALSDRLATLGQSAWVVTAHEQAGFPAPALATREATGKD